jgi:hypothetical protein
MTPNSSRLPQLTSFSSKANNDVMHVVRLWGVSHKRASYFQGWVIRAFIAYPFSYAPRRRFHGPSVAEGSDLRLHIRS